MKASAVLKAMELLRSLGSASMAWLAVLWAAA
jgi:hypothetical protein